MRLEQRHSTGNMTGNLAVPGGRNPEPLSDAVRDALERYFDQLGGTPAADLHQLVIRQVEKPLFESVLRHAGGNQSRAATMLGISRSTLRKKLAMYEIE